MTTEIDLSIVVVSFNTEKLTIQCIESIKKYIKNIKYEIIVCENGSQDKSLAAIKKLNYKNLVLIDNKKNLGFSGGNNIGMKKAKGRYVLLLNSDTKFTSHILDEIVSYMDQHPEVGISTCALKNADGSYQGSGGYFPNLIRVFSWMTIEDFPFVTKFIKPFHPMRPKSYSKNESFYKKEHDIDWLTGAFFLIRRKVIEDVGYFDNDYFMYTEDTDYCFRAKKAGWKIKYLPKWSVIHYGGSSSTKEYPIISEFKGIKIFYKKHYPRWQLPLAILFLKIGALGRMVLFGILEGRKGFITYAKAFRAI